VKPPATFVAGGFVLYLYLPATPVLLLVDSLAGASLQLVPLD